jgi:Mor family transcriptional regulator
MSSSNPITDVLRSDIAASIKDSIGLHDRIALELADGILRSLQANWGGREIYIPVQASVDRNAKIKAEFYAKGNDPKRYADVCRNNDISLSTLYRILRED